MKQREQESFGIKPAETLKLKRILDWMRENRGEGKRDTKVLQTRRANFIRFFEEHDKRRGTDLYGTFPEMKVFFKTCQDSL